MVTSEKFLTKFFCFSTSWLCDEMVVFVSLCQVSAYPYQATSDMPMPMHNTSKKAWLQVSLMSRGVIEVVIR